MRSFSAILLVFCSLFCFAQPDDVGSGRSLYFDGVNDYIELGNVYDALTFPFTVSAWVRMDPGNAEPRPIFVSNDENNTYDGFWVFVTPAIILAECGDGQGDGLPEFRRGKQALITNSKIEGSWAHIAVVFRSESNIEIFLDGIRLNSTPSNGQSTLPLKQNVPGATARIGHHSSGGVTYHFKGYMDELKLFNTALSQQSIQDQMCKKINSSEPGLIGYWPFNETSGNTAVDSSPTSHNGTLVNNPQRTFSGAPVGDASTYEYNASWTGEKVTMISAAHTVNVENVVNNPEGIHIYRIDNLPSQTSGIDLTKVSAPYFGVFAARSNYQIERRFDIDYEISGADVCALHDRKDNSVSSWGQKTKLLNVAERVEFLNLFTGTPNFNVDLGPDRFLCNQATSVLAINVDPTGKSILWSTGQTTPEILVTASGSYHVTVSQDCHVEKDTIFVSIETLPEDFSLGNDEIFCPLTPRMLQAPNTQPGLSFKWQDGSTLPVFEATNYGVYWVEVSNNCGIAIDTLELLEGEDIAVELGPDLWLCDQASYVLSTNQTATGQVTLWNTGASTPSITITQSGFYKVQVSKDCKVGKDSLFVSFLNTPPQFSLGKDTIICNPQNILLNPIGQSSPDFEFLWQDGSTGSTYTVNDHGGYWLKIENACGNWMDTVNYRMPELVDYKIPNIITPNGDPYNQTFQIHEILIGSWLDVFNRWGKKVYSSSDYHNEWDGGELPASTYFYKLFSPCMGEFKGTVSIQK
jgi:gliding motility-associated-like protein